MQKRIIIFFMGFLCLFSTSFVYAGQQNDAEPVLSIIKKRNGRVKINFKVGDEIVIWIKGETRPKHGVMTSISPDSIHVNGEAFTISNIKAVARGGELRGLKLFLNTIGFTAIAAGTILLVILLASWNSLEADPGYLALIFTSTITFGFLFTSLLRPFKKKKYSFKYQEVQD